MKNMQNDLVSIITPTYNSSRYISETIKSIQAQTYSNWELLITDDCSSDNTVEIIRQFMRDDSRIKLFQLEVNSGAGAARNRSIKESIGRYIAMCDSDDMWYPTKLEQQINTIKLNGCFLCYSSYMLCNSQGAINGIVVCRSKETLTSIKRDDKIGFLTVMYDSAKIGKIYMPLLRKRQDWGWLILVMQKCSYAVGIKEPLAIYRIHSDSISANKISLIRYNIAVYQNVLCWSKPHALLYFGFVFIPSYIYKKILIRLYNN